ncbi:MAG: hypothetical protein SNJ56_06570 [Termitinemataceae bacterium]
MKISDAIQVVDGEFFCGQRLSDLEVHSACGADLMSDVMAFVKEEVLLLTGLVNSQVIRTAELMDIKAILFVRGKRPTLDMIELAESQNIILAGTKLPMFLACGKLYEAGLRSGGTRKI